MQCRILLARKKRMRRIITLAIAGDTLYFAAIFGDLLLQLRYMSQHSSADE